MRHGSLFSGIGGFDLAAEWMGWENVFHCEWNPFGQRVLKHYWPHAESFDDITKTNFKKYANTIDILTGGFPCQPYSSAGKRKGKEDERHLWPEMLRAIREIKPKYIVGENVFGLLNWNGGMVFDEVHTDLESEGYEVQAMVIPAAAVGAAHGRDRVWFVAYDNSQRQSRYEQQIGNWNNNTNSKQRICICEKKRFNEVWCVHDRNSKNGNATNTNGNGLNQCNCNDEINASQGGEYAFGNTKSVYANWDQFPTQSPICGGDDGLPSELDGITFPKWRSESIKAYGNAIVPQVAYEIFKAIELSDKQLNLNYE